MLNCIMKLEIAEPFNDTYLSCGIIKLIYKMDFLTSPDFLKHGIETRHFLLWLVLTEMFPIDGIC